MTPQFDLVATNTAVFDTDPSTFVFPLPEDYEGYGMEHSLRSFPRRKRVLDRKNFQRTPLTTRDVIFHLQDTLRPFAAKEIANASGSSPKAAENVKQGLNAMSLAHFLNACREIPELKDLAMELMGETPSLNASEEQALSVLVNRFVRREMEQ